MPKEAKRIIGASLKRDPCMHETTGISVVEMRWKHPEQQRSRKMRAKVATQALAWFTVTVENVRS